MNMMMIGKIFIHKLCFCYLFINNILITIYYRIMYLVDKMLDFEQENTCQVWY